MTIPQQIRNVPIDQIGRNPAQPRETFPDDHIARLAASIQTRGLIQPITIKRTSERAKPAYVIVAGECRYRAHVLLERKTIACIVVAIDDREMQLRAIVENMQRRDMNPIEEARAFQILLDQDMSAEQIVEELGLKSTALVQQRVLLLRLVPEVQALVASGQLASTMAGGVAQLPPRLQIGMVQAITAGKFQTSEQVKHACIALRDAEQQLDVFAAMPRASQADLQAITKLENKIRMVVSMVGAGFKDGECVAAQRVSPDRVKTMADQLALIRKHILQMEHDLRRLAVQVELRLEAAQ